MRRGLALAVLLLLLPGQPVAARADGDVLPGWQRFNDPGDVFKVDHGLIHVLDVPEGPRDFAYLITDREYSNYEFTVRYRWGQKRFAPRAFDKRDAGILYHVVGPDVIWPRSVESQIQEGDTGDIFLVSGTGASTTITPNVALPERQYLAGGEPYAQIDGRIVKAETVDSLTDWNLTEIVVTGTESAHIVNGTVVARMSDMTQPAPDDPSRRIALDRGRILLQAEGAEVFYDAVEIKEFTDLGVPPPPGGLVLFDSLEMCPGCGDRRSDTAFQDFRLHVEFNVPATPPGTPEQERGNSGIYLQGRYELQVLDSFGFALADQNDAGAIYGLSDAAENAARPSGVWQSYDVTFQAAHFLDGAKTANARVSVVWNGKPVHADLELPGPTAGGSPETPDAGPIVLQGHGHPVRYRNVWLLPL